MEIEEIRKNLEKSIADELIGEPIRDKGVYRTLSQSIEKTPLFNDVVERWENKKVSENIYLDASEHVLIESTNRYNLGVKIYLRNKDGRVLDYPNSFELYLFRVDISKRKDKDGWRNHFVWSDVKLSYVSATLTISLLEKDASCIDEEIEKRLENLLYSREKKKKEEDMYCDYVEKIAECLSVTLYEAIQICNKISQKEFKIINDLSERKKVKE